MSKAYERIDELEDAAPDARVEALQVQNKRQNTAPAVALHLFLPWMVDTHSDPRPLHLSPCSVPPPPTPIRQQAELEAERAQAEAFRELKAHNERSLARALAEKEDALGTVLANMAGVSMDEWTGLATAQAPVRERAQTNPDI